MATKPSSKTKAGVAVKLSDLKSGWDKHFTGKQTLMVKGTTYTPTTMDTQLDSLIQPFTDAETAETTVKAARTTAKASEAEAEEFAIAFTSALKGALGPTNPLLLDFGIALPKPPTPLTAEENVAKAAKAAHTRVIRGTMSAKKKAALKSTATFTVTTTQAGSPAPGAVASAPMVTSSSAPAPASVPTSAAAPAPAAAPAASASANVSPAQPAAPAAGGGQQS